MSENTACSNKKCPMYKNDFSANTRTCMTCTYKVSINPTEVNLSNNYQINSYNKTSLIHNASKDDVNKFKNIKENISNMTYNYSKTVSSSTLYSTESNLGDFYKIKKGSLKLSTKILLSVMIIFMLATLCFIAKMLAF